MFAEYISLSGRVEAVRVDQFMIRVFKGTFHRIVYMDAVAALPRQAEFIFLVFEYASFFFRGTDWCHGFSLRLLIDDQIVDYVGLDIIIRGHPAEGSV